MEDTVKEAEPFDTMCETALAALEAGDWETGITSLESALELEPEDADCAYNIGCCMALRVRKNKLHSWQP